MQPGGFSVPWPVVTLELKAEVGGLIFILYFDTDWMDLGMALVLATTGIYQLLLWRRSAR